MIKNIIRYTFLPFNFVKDLIYFKFFKKNSSEKSHNFFVILFCLTGGLSNKILDFFLSSPNKFFDSSSTYLKNVDKKVALKNLNQYGYFFNQDILSSTDIEKIKSFLKNKNGIYRSDQYFSKSKEHFDITNPKATTFHYDKNDLIENEVIQKLVIDKNIVSIVGDYFEKAPMLDSIDLWWSLPSKNPDSTSAQEWHFDLDRTKWLKVFIYLTDCAEENGPHCFIQKSHNDNGIPFSIRKKGYQRIKDELIKKYYDENDIKQFIARKGSVLFENTRGLHKAKKVESGSRLILILQYSTNLFGHTNSKIKFPKNSCQDFENCKKNNKYFFSNFEQ